jgi:hypothetical protein
METLPPQTPPYHRLRHPGPDNVVSRHYVTALRETSEATVPGVRAGRHTCSALLPQAAWGYPSVRRFTQTCPVTATVDLPRTRRLRRRQVRSGARPKPLLSGGCGRPLLGSAEGPVP